MQVNKLQPYQQYLSLSLSQRQKRTSNAKQNSHCLPNPQANHVFPEINFIKFDVEQQGKQIQLATYRYPSINKPKCLVIMFHGLNAHIGNGAHIALAMSHHGIETVGFDHRGFGQSEGVPGKMESIEQHFADSEKFIDLIMQEYRGLPVFVLGQSMGGMTAYYMSLRRPHLFAGAILFAPALKNTVGGCLVGLTKTLHRFLPEGTKLTRPFRSMSSDNPQIEKDTNVDKYTYQGRGWLSNIHSLVDVMDRSPESFHLYDVPFMVIQGGCDKIVNPQVAFQLFTASRTSQPDKQILFYETMWHDIWHSQEIGGITRQVIEWIESRVPQYEQYKLNQRMEEDK